MKGIEERGRCDEAGFSRIHPDYVSLQFAGDADRSQICAGCPRSYQDDCERSVESISVAKAVLCMLANRSGKYSL